MNLLVNLPWRLVGATTSWPKCSQNSQNLANFLWINLVARLTNRMKRNSKKNLRNFLSLLSQSTIPMCFKLQRPEASTCSKTEGKLKKTYESDCDDAYQILNCGAGQEHRLGSLNKNGRTFRIQSMLILLP